MGKDKFICFLKSKNKPEKSLKGLTVNAILPNLFASGKQIKFQILNGMTRCGVRLPEWSWRERML